MKKYLYSLLTVSSLSVPIFVSAKCSRTKEELEKEIISNLNSYSLYDEQLIFKQDNSPQNINIKVINDEFLKQEISANNTIESNIIIFEKWKAFPFDFSDDPLRFENNEVYTNKTEVKHFRYIFHENIFLSFKRYSGSYRDNFLFDFKTNVFQGNVKEFQPKFDDFKKFLPSLDYKKRPFNFDTIENFNHYGFYKDVDKYSSKHSFDIAKKYLFFTGTNLSDKNNDDVFYWMPHIKNNKMVFSRVIKNEKLKSFFSNDAELIRTIKLKTWMFDIEKIKQLLKLPNDQELIFEKHVQIEDNVYYQNFSNEYKKNMIWTKEDFLNKYSLNKKERKLLQEILERKVDNPPAIPHTFRS
ncbi:hypothetical protein ACJA25_03575 [Mycoplasmopsis hyopharyngis]|uniref:hypothetical protein n=1 Tax=Mycoplasmopsis hyopharyngis TaxID=29558 RepID=UPI003873174D